ncbi:MAG: hypothetical protein QOJ35_2316 [Solirubrobacteraceae bacterium]|jgi:hypothetical protein|nr:hypothetical protein [Solirubrobacteraceae bacterium]
MAPARDDRVLRTTRLLAAFIVPFLLVAFALLYLFPGDTKSYFAWEIHPDIQPMIMGAGYVAGAYFFARVFTERRFHRVHVGFLPVTAFTIFMAAGSFAHLDRFLQDHVAFWIWMGLYVTTPILVPLAWLANRRTDPGHPEPGESLLGAPVRRLLVGAGALQATVALVLLLLPSTMIDVWPWALTPLTAQTLGGWFALPGITAIMMGLDGRPSAIRITLQSQVIGLALILLAVAVRWGSLDSSNALSYVLVAGLGGLLIGLLALDLHMRRGIRTAPVVA